jgi:hypothetical protein
VAPPIRVGFDTETHLSIRGRTAPRLVCLSLAWRGSLRDLPTALPLGRDGERLDRQIEIAAGAVPVEPGRIWTVLLAGPSAVLAWGALVNGAMRGALDLVAHNAAYDLPVLNEAAAVHPASAGPTLAGVLDLLEPGRAGGVPGRAGVRCTLVRETLIAIAHGRFKGAPRGYFQLGSEIGLVKRYLGADRAELKGKHEPCPSCGGGDCPPDPGCIVCEGFGSIGPWRMRYSQLDGIPLDNWPTEAASYALGDSVDALLVSECQDHAPATSIGPLVEIDNRGRRLIADETKQTDHAHSLTMLAARGICVDPEQTAGLDEVVTAIADKATAIGVRAGFIRGADGRASYDPTIKPGRPGSVCKAALHGLVSECYAGAPPRNDPSPTEKKKAEAEEREPVGSVKADRDVLLATGHPDLIEYGEAGAALTLARTYVPILREGVALGPVGEGGGTVRGIGADAEGNRIEVVTTYPTPHGPITSRPNVLVGSGRVSWRDPNLTNPPREGGFRDCFVPRPGWIILLADLGTAEFRALGQICLWEGFGSTIAEAFREGRDPHLEFAGDLLGIPYADAAARYADGDPLVKSRRQVAKVANYGFPGGMGGERFVAHARKQGVELHPDRAQALGIAWELHGAFRRKWPEVIPYFAWIGRRTGTKEDPRRFTLRQYISGRLRGQVGYCDGCNGYFQGLIADGAKAGTSRIVRECYADARPDLLDRERHTTDLTGCRPILFLHDENGVEVPCGDGSPRYPLDAAHLTRAADRMERVMVDEMQPYTPDIPVLVEPGACLRWRKGADEVRDGRGLLLPCDLPPGAVVL